MDQSSDECRFAQRFLTFAASFSRSACICRALSSQRGSRAITTAATTPPPSTGESSSKNPARWTGYRSSDTAPKTDAERDLAALPAMDPLEAVKRYRNRHILFEQGKARRRHRSLRDAAVSYPTYAEPWRLMGQAYEKKGELGEAIKCLSGIPEALSSRANPQETRSAHRGASEETAARITKARREIAAPRRFKLLQSLQKFMRAFVVRESPFFRAEMPRCAPAIRTPPRESDAARAASRDTAHIPPRIAAPRRDPAAC